MASHNITCHPILVNSLHLNPSQTGQYLIYLPQRDGRLSWPWCWLYTETVHLYKTITRLSSNYLIASRLGVEPTTSQLQVQRANITLPSLNVELTVHHVIISSCNQPPPELLRLNNSLISAAVTNRPNNKSQKYK